MIKLSILGATGYAGIELTRLLLSHPQVQIMHAVSKSFAGQKLKSVYPNLCNTELVLEDTSLDKIANDSELVFTSLPHGLSAETASFLYSKNVKIIDLSGDFRYDDVKVYEEWYKVKHTHPELLKEKVFGLPELYRDKIKKAKLIGNPGCYTTCSILPLYPLLEAGLVSPKHIIIDAKSGISGAGRSEKLAYTFCETDESFKAYGLATHRHTSEIEQEVSKAAGVKVELSFSPHLLPVKRGILCTIYTELEGKTSRQDIMRCYEKYMDEPFVKVYPEGLPELKHVNGSSNCLIGFMLDERLNRLIVVSVLDNLLKGAAGQAVQNMNILYGFDETLGLPRNAWYL